jgi:zinc protease
MLDKGSRLSQSVLSEDQIADVWADEGAVFGASASAERASIRIRTLSQADRRQRVIKIAQQMLKEPLFDEKIFQRERERVIASLRESNTKPESILSKEFSKALYPNHPRGIDVTEQDLKNIQVKHLKSFYRNYFVQDQVKVTIVGDISRQDAQQLVDDLLSQFPRNTTVNRDLPPVKKLPVDTMANREKRIAHPSQQAHITMGTIAITRNDPDYFPLLVGNYVLGGGGFVSRLVKEVREKRGLAYSVYSYIAPGKEPGPFAAGMQTQIGQIQTALDVMRTTIGDYVNQGPTDEELAAAKANLINGFPLRIDSNRKLLDNVASIAWLGLPLDTLDRWTQEVANVNADQIRQALKKHIQMNTMVTVVVGGP